MEPVIITGYDEKYEEFFPYWWHCVSRFNSAKWPVYVCDFGFSDLHKKLVEAAGARVYKSPSSKKGWFLKPFALWDCPSRFGVYIDIDAEAMKDLQVFSRWIRPGRIGAAPDPNDVFVYQVDCPLNSGVIPFDNQSKGVQQWCDAVNLIGEYTSESIINAYKKKGDQALLNLMVERKHIDIIPRELNWFGRINDVNDQCDPDAIIWHHLGPIGKQRFLVRSNLAAKGLGL